MKLKTIRFKLLHLILLGLLLPLFATSCADKEVLKSFRLKNGQTLNIYADMWLDKGRCVYYLIKKGKQEIVPISVIDSIGPNGKYKFTLYQSNDGNLIAVSTEEYPTELIIIHDFETGESWPYIGFSEDSDSAYKRGEKLLNKFSKELLQQSFKLGSLHG